MRRVYMSFMQRNGWYCQFLEEDLKTSLPRKLAVTTTDKVREMAQRGRAKMGLEEQQSLNHAFEIGRGGVWLSLTEEQYRRLK